MGVNHLPMSMQTFNFKIVAETLVSDTGGGKASFDLHANS